MHSRSALTLRVDSAQAEQALGSLMGRLLEKFPEASFDLIHELLLRALDSGAIGAGCAATLAGDGIAGLEIRLDTARIVEFVASALRAGQGNCVAHGRPLSELIDVEERQSYPSGAGRPVADEHVPGDTATPPAPDAIVIGPLDA